MFSFLPTLFSMVGGLFKSKSSIMIDLVLGLIVALLVFFGYGKYQSMKRSIAEYKTMVVREKAINNSMQDKINNLKNINKANNEKLVEIKKQYESDLEAIKKKMKKDSTRIKVVTVIKDRIKHVKPKDDGPVAKVLMDTLSQIRRLDKK